MILSNLIIAQPSPIFFLIWSIVLTQIFKTNAGYEIGHSSNFNLLRMTPQNILENVNSLEDNIQTLPVYLQQYKRNLEALARAGYLKTLPDENTDDLDNTTMEAPKRSLAALVKNGQLPNSTLQKHINDEYDFYMNNPSRYFHYDKDVPATGEQKRNNPPLVGYLNFGSKTNQYDQETSHKLKKNLGSVKAQTKSKMRYKKYPTEMEEKLKWEELENSIADIRKPYSDENFMVPQWLVNDNIYGTSKRFLGRLPQMSKTKTQPPKSQTNSYSN